MTYRFEEIEVDTASFELKRGGSLVQVEPQVFDVLSYLVQHRDRIVTRDELLDNVWNDRYVSDSALSSRIMSARKAIGDDGKEQRLIKTVHGRGFRFVGELHDSSCVKATDPIAAPVPSFPHPTLCIGRSAELASLHESFSQALEGNRTAVFLTGQAGMGKSTLLRDFLVSISDRAMVVLGQSQAFSGTSEPFRTLIQALSDFASQNPELPVARTMRQRSPTWLAQVPWIASEEEWEEAKNRAQGATQERMLREFIDCIEGLSQTSPIVIAIDDVHWCDSQTIDALLMTSRRFNPARIMVVGAMRPNERTSDGRQPHAALREAIARGEIREIHIECLSRESVAEITRARLSAESVDEELVGSIYRRTEGHPLFLSTVLEEVDRFGTEALHTVPANIRNLVQMHFENLEPHDQEIVGAASCISRQFCSAAVASMLDLAPDSLEGQVIKLSRLGRFFDRIGVEQLEGGASSPLFRFNHDLVIEVVSDLVPQSKKPIWLRRFAFWAEKAFAWELDRRALGFASHFATGEEWAKSVEYLVRASKIALDRAASRDALAIAMMGMERLKKIDDEETRKKLELQVLCVMAPAKVTAEGWTEEAQSIFDRALSLAEKFGNAEERFALIFGLATLFEMRGEYRESARLMNDLADSEARELLACSNFHQGKFNEALECAEQALKNTNAHVHSSLTARFGENPAVSCEQWASLSLWFIGRPKEATERAKKAVELAESPELKYALTNARGQLAFLSQIKRDVEETRLWSLATIEIGEKQGSAYRVAFAEILLGWAEAMLNGSESGVERMIAGIKSIRSIGAVIEEPYLLGVVGDGLLHVQRIEDAKKYLDEAIRLADTKRGFFFESELFRLRGTAENDRKKSRPWFERAVASAEKQNNNAILLRSLTSLASTGHEPAIERLRMLISDLPEDFECKDVDRARNLLDALA